MRRHGRGAVLLVLAVVGALWSAPGLAQEQRPDREGGSEELECGRCSNLASDYDTGPRAAERLTSPGTVGCDPSVTAPEAAGNCPRSGDAGGGPGDAAGPGGGASGGPAGSGSGGAAGGAPSPPPPPTLAEAVATCPSPQPPVIGRDPDPEGVTGMATYLWAQPQAALSSSASVRGYPVACTIAPVRWTWRTGDGGAYTRERPGGPYPDHAAEHVYETKGDYEMTLTVVWRAATTYGSAAVSRTTAQPYHVFEIRSVLTG